MAAREVAGGGRRVEVPPERLERWLAGFRANHGESAVSDAQAGGLAFSAADGATALVEPAFPPLADATEHGLLEHALRGRRFGVVLARLGGHAVGVVDGRALVVSKVGSRQVHGRSAAGGWSQQRFARRREGQVSVATTAAADVVARLLLPELARLDSVVTGGERTMLAAVLSDSRLRELGPLVADRVLDVPDPRRDVLVAAVDRARSATITVRDPAPSR